MRVGHTGLVQAVHRRNGDVTTDPLMSARKRASNVNRTEITRRSILGTALAGAVAAGIGAADQGPAAAAAAFPVPPFDLEEAAVTDLQAAMAAGRLTSKAITAKYLERIDALDRRGPTLRHVIETNPEALKIAEQLDAERKANGARGPLHGVPVLVKDNVNTADRMTTTSGSLALEGHVAAKDAFLVARLRGPER